jgi:hypothetical protein
LKFQAFWVVLTGQSLALQNGLVTPQDSVHLVFIPEQAIADGFQVGWFILILPIVDDMIAN